MQFAERMQELLCAEPEAEQPVLRGAAMEVVADGGSAFLGAQVGPPSAPASHGAPCTQRACIRSCEDGHTF